MDWINELSQMERLLRKDLDRLNRIKGDDENSVLIRTLLRKMIALRVKGIDSILSDYLCGRNNFERDLMQYQARINLPVFSLLKGVMPALKN
ncbi:MAG: hypothetical protein J7K04_10890 [Spirochaetales bacterium]|nr:hypothetical protein [Spirochaetales bacterium]